jgi:flavin reductase (DIM6/NTAB) family NADH-FMN oxidoreductase RutF
MITVKCEDLSTLELQNYLQYAVAPRPICFASTIDLAGNVNLSPFSFFNMFSTNPPVCIFSPARRVRDNTIKHTLENVMEVKECVINIVNYSMVQQMSLASSEYAKGINEFEKSGFTMLPSEIVSPPRVAEAPVQFECVVTQIIPLGDQNGAGNLILAEIKLIHISESVLDDNGKIDQNKMDLVARLGGDWYCRVTEDNLFKIPKPISTNGIGVDTLPESIRKSKILTGNELGVLGNMPNIPNLGAIEKKKECPQIKSILNSSAINIEEKQLQIHKLISSHLKNSEFEDALEIAFLKI